MFRLLGLLGGLSVALDMGAGAPLEESLRRALVAARLGRGLGCSDDEISAVIYASLLQHLGCTAASHELAEVYSDDVAAIRWSFLASDPRSLWAAFAPGVAAATGRPRVRVMASALMGGRRIQAIAPRATCEVARDASRRLGLPAPVQEALYHTTARWDGGGFPPVGGEDVPRTTRIMHVASVAVLFHLHAGPAAAMAELQRRSDSELDPELVDAFSSDLLVDVAEADAYAEVLDAEPGAGWLIDPGSMESVARTFGDVVDLKSPWLQGHAAGVAGVAGAAGRVLGLEQDVLTVAGFLHDIGRVGTSSRIWDKPGRLSVTERSQVEMHAYHSEQILSRVPELGSVAALVGRHHERLDGSGYHRGLHGPQLSMPARVLAASDRYRTLVEARAHRAALTVDAAGRVLREDARAGRLDGDAVAAVLVASGGQAGARHVRPAGLTQRQLEVLRLVATGSSNADIARRLVISSRTAEHHVQDVYLKIGSTSRAAAALFAMEHGLLGPPVGEGDPAAEDG